MMKLLGFNIWKFDFRWKSNFGDAIVVPIGNPATAGLRFVAPT